ncbi:MFS transporter [Acetobacter sp. DsW_063]|uniref:MFS transporter n=1 Tax=Acetobacter sp. DsW_063 TaxID=1514894 RepID=UPI000A367459|nr:MFS transporter [Acetobacter sp. DsW_063]OUJ16117.1 MFS transporter [Acetobacter sp. DsW_063]
MPDQRPQTVTSDLAASQPLRTTIPARLDRLPWSRFHTLLVAALGVTWILDGLEVTIVGTLGPVLKRSDTLSLTDAQVGEAASAYVTGAVLGALGFGWATDRMGRRHIFVITLALYIIGVGLSGLSWNATSFMIFRMITGLGIGGEYAAINSAIDELVPARVRGRVDLFVNGTFWAGAALGAGASMGLLKSQLLPVPVVWRLLFVIGAILGMAVVVLRRWVPESPRWLMTHRRVAEAESVVEQIERRVRADGVEATAMNGILPSVAIYPAGSFSLLDCLKVMIGDYRGRTAYVLVLMIAQAFLYNAVFFTYGLVLTRYGHVADEQVGLYIFPLALGNLLGPLLLGRFFDTVGRRRMIAISYGVSGLLMLAVSWLFGDNVLTAFTQTIFWSAIFFFASAAASAAYLTASEIFPLEMRALAIALFYAVGTLFGGVAAPTLFGRLIEAPGPAPLACGYLASAILMLAAAAVTLKWGVDAEGQSLEAVAPPLSSSRR